MHHLYENGAMAPSHISDGFLPLSFQYSYAECLGHHQEGTVGQDCRDNEGREGGRARRRGP